MLLNECFLFLGTYFMQKSICIPCHIQQLMPSPEITTTLDPHLAGRVIVIFGQMIIMISNMTAICHLVTQRPILFRFQLQ